MDKVCKDTGSGKDLLDRTLTAKEIAPKISKGITSNLQGSAQQKKQPTETQTTEWGNCFYQLFLGQRSNI